MILTNGSRAPETVLATLTLDVPGTHLTTQVRVPVVPATITPNGGIVDVRAEITRAAISEAIDKLIASR